MNPITNDTYRKTLPNEVNPDYVPGSMPGYVPDNTEIKKTSELIAPLLRGEIKIFQVKGDNGDQLKEPELPELDKAINGGPEDVERLLKYLILTEDEAQVRATAKRLQAMLHNMDTEQQQVLQKVNEAIAELKKQEDAQSKSGVLGWILTGLSILAAAVTIAITLGAATPLAIAGCVLTCAATALALTNQILTTTGVREKHCEKRAKEMMQKDPKLTYDDALKKANKEWDLGWGITQGILAVAALGVGIGGLIAGGADAAVALAELTKEGVEISKLSTETVQQALRLAQTALGLTQGGLSIGQAVIAAQIAKFLEHQAKTEAELAEVKLLLEKVRQMVEEEQDKLKQMLERIQDVLAFLDTLTEKKNEHEGKILSRIGA